MNLDTQVKNRWWVSSYLKSLLFRVANLEKTAGPDGVATLTGDAVDNTDPLNPVVVIPTLQEVTDKGNTTTYEVDVRNVLIRDVGTDNYATFDTSGINDNRTYTFPDSDGTLALLSDIGGGASELEKLNEGNGDGYRLLGKNPALFGNVGLNAIDFSDSDDLSSTRGATGTRAFATGSNNIVGGVDSAILGGMGNSIDVNTVASTILGGGNNVITVGEYSTILGGYLNTVTGARAIAAGFFNTAKSFTEVVIGGCATNYVPVGVTTFWEEDRAFNVGVGPDSSTRRDGFTVFKNARSKFGGVAQLKNYTVGTLPVGVEGDTAYVTDATAPTYLGALVGGGAVKCPVFFNGTIWVSH